MRLKFVKYGLWIASDNLRFVYGFCVDRVGIWFPYKGDEVGWVWPWKRKYGSRWKYLSISFGTYFESLKHMDIVWEEYAEACRKSDARAADRASQEVAEEF